MVSNNFKFVTDRLTQVGPFHHNTLESVNITDQDIDFLISLHQRIQSGELKISNFFIESKIL